MVAVGGRDAKTPLATCPDAVPPHRKLDPPLADPNALFASVCSKMPSAFAAAATFWPEVTERTASRLYSNV
jgi:hypothetical protein